MSNFSTLERRFFMRYLPDAVSATSERARQQAIAEALAETPFGHLQDKAKAFFAHASPDTHHREVKTRLFGVGEHRHYHAEHNLTDVPMRDMPTLHAMIQRRATINTELMDENDEAFASGEYIEAQQRMFNLWLTDLRHDALRFIIANSVGMEHGFLAHELLHDAMETCIPREVQVADSDAGLQVHFHVEGELHQRIWRELTRRANRRIDHWIARMEAATQERGYPDDAVSVDEEIDEHGHPRTTYCFFSAQTPHHVRLDHWDADIDPLPRVSRKAHLDAIRTRFEQPIRDEVEALYHALIQEARDSEATPLYTRDTGNSIFLAPDFFDKD